MGRRNREPNEIPKALYDLFPKYCANCGSDEGLELHHIVPVALGGHTVLSNLVVLCTKCHFKTHGINPDVINHSELIKAGIAARKAKGLHVGKPSADHEAIQALIAKHCTMFAGGTWTEQEIMQKAECKRTLFHECLNDLIKDLQQEEWHHTYERPVQIRERPLHAKTIKAMRSHKKLKMV